MNSYEFSKFYSEKIVKIVQNLIDGKKYKNYKKKNGYEFNMKSYGFKTNFLIKFVNGVIKDGELYLDNTWKAICSCDNITIPIFHEGNIIVDLHNVQSILIHEFTHCYQSIQGTKPFSQPEEEYDLWLSDEDEQEAILNQFQFELDCGKSFAELIKIKNFNELYKWYPQLFNKFRKE